jgi:hypothetical protein
MKKTIFLVALGIITVFCICYGTVKHMGGMKNVFGDCGIHFSFDDDCDLEEDNGKFSLNQKLEKFSELDIDVRIMALTIQEGTDFAIESSFNKSYLKPVLEVRGNTLKISQQNFRSIGLNAGNQTCRVLLTIPSGTSLGSLNVSSNVGDVRLRDFNAEKIDLNLNVGEVTIRNVDFNDFICSNNVGEISVDPVADINDYDMKLSTDVGEISVDGHSYKRSYNTRGTAGKKISVDTNVGEINIK